MRQALKFLHTATTVAFLGALLLPSLLAVVVSGLLLVVVRRAA